MLGVTVRSGTPIWNAGVILAGEPLAGVPVINTVLSVAGCVGVPADIQKLTGTFGAAVNVSTPPV